MCTYKVSELLILHHYFKRVVRKSLQLIDDGNCQRMFCLFRQHANSGGGSGGAVWIKAAEFKGRGFIYANGGDGNAHGGGGAGGRVNVFFEKGDFKSGHVEAKGL